MGYRGYDNVILFVLVSFPVGKYIIKFNHSIVFSVDFRKIFCPAGLTNSSVAIVVFKYVFAYWAVGSDVVGNSCL